MSPDGPGLGRPECYKMRGATRFFTVDDDTPRFAAARSVRLGSGKQMGPFIIEAVNLLSMEAARVNERGAGDPQYPPSLLRSLLIYCCATGTFSRRKVERLTYAGVAVRYLCVETPSPHDSICKFRRENKDLLASTLHQVLECAALAKILKVGEFKIAAGGTKMPANASKHSAVSQGSEAAERRFGATVSIS